MHARPPTHASVPTAHACLRMFTIRQGSRHSPPTMSSCRRLHVHACHVARQYARQSPALYRSSCCARYRLCRKCRYNAHHAAPPPPLLIISTMIACSMMPIVACPLSPKPALRRRRALYAALPRHSRYATFAMFTRSEGEYTSAFAVESWVGYARQRGG